MTSSFMNHVSWSLGDHENNYLTTFLSHSTKYDIVVILVFFSELFDGHLIRGSMRIVFFRLLVGTACMVRNQELYSNVQVRTRAYRISHSKKLRLDPDLFRPSFYTFLCLLVSSKGAQFKNSNWMRWQCHPGGSRVSQKKTRKMMKKINRWV